MRVTDERAAAWQIYIASELSRCGSLPNEMDFLCDLLADREEAKADTNRMDWLIRHRATVTHTTGSIMNMLRWCDGMTDSWNSIFADVREHDDVTRVLIDRAMKGAGA